MRVFSTESAGTAGLWMAPTGGCTHRAWVEGGKEGAHLSFSTDPGPCLHLVRHTGRMRDLGGGASGAIMAVTDLRTCTVTER